MSTIRLGSRTTAEQALRGASLFGKRAIVTGASSGLGVETTRVRALDLADFGSVRPFTDAIVTTLQVKNYR